MPPRMLVVLALSLASQTGSDISIKQMVIEAGEARTRGQPERALQILEDANRIRPSPTLWNNIAQTLEDLGRYREAYDLYQKVEAAPDAKPELRERDVARARALLPKLDRPWVRCHGGNVLIDGRALGADEIALAVGPKHAIEHRPPGSPTAIVRFMALPIGLRTTLREEDIAPRPDDAHLTLPRDISLSKLAVDGFALSLGAGLESIALAPGEYSIEAVTRDGRSLRTRLVLNSSEDQLIDVPAPAMVEKTAAPEPQRTGPWPYVLIIGGGVTAGVAGALFFSARQDENAFFAHATLPGQPYQFATFTRAQAQPIEDRYAHKIVGAEIALGAAVSALIGGAIWALLSP